MILLKYILLQPSVWFYNTKRPFVRIILIAFMVTSLGIFFPLKPAHALQSQWSGLLRKISNTSQVIVSLQMQQIHSFNFIIDPTKWQLESIQTYENKEHYEFSKNFKCVSKNCDSKTLLAMTFITYKYGVKLFTQAQLEQNYPASKWQNIFKTGSALRADFQKKITVQGRDSPISYGYRYQPITMGKTKLNGRIDLLYYDQSQVKLMISSPSTKQTILDDLLEKIEDSMKLQKIR